MTEKPKDPLFRANQEHTHLILLEEVARAWSDVEAGRLLDIAELQAKYGYLVQKPINNG